MNSVPTDDPLDRLNNLYGSGSRIKRRPGLLAQIRMVLFQPRLFFKFQATNASQHWLVIACIVLALTALSAVRQQQIINTWTSVVIVPPAARASNGEPGSSQVPDSGTSAANGGSPDIVMAWKPALTAASEIVFDWLLFSLILLIVPLSQMRAPHFGQNLKVVVWASLPLGLMAALQLLYYGSGGQPGNPGLSGLVARLPGFDGLPGLSQMLMMSFSSHVTLFWLWSLALTYFGGRYVLGGKRLIVILVLLLWIGWLVALPVAANNLSQRSQVPLPTLVPFSGEAPTPTQGPS